MGLTMQWKRGKCLRNHGDGIEQHHHHTTIEEKEMALVDGKKKNTKKNLAHKQQKVIK